MMSVEKLYTDLKEIGIVENQGDFSYFCGRKFSWCSAAISRERDMSLEALLACYCNLLAARDKEQKTGNFATYEELNRVCKTVWDEMCCGVEDLCISLAA